MNCHDAREQFSALIDDALAADERAALDAHLATCADCRRELQRFRDTVALMGGAAPVRAPAGFVDRVLEAARPVPWHRRLLHAVFLPWPIKLPMEAAAIVLVSVGVAMVYRGSPELQQSARQEPTAALARRAVGEIPSEPRTLEPKAPESAPRVLYGTRDYAEREQAVRELEKTKEAARAREVDKGQEPGSLADKKQTETPAMAQSAPPPASGRLESGAAGSKAPAPSRDAELYKADVRQDRQAPVVGKLESSVPPTDRQRSEAKDVRPNVAQPAEKRADPLRAQRPASAPPSIASSAFAPPDVSGQLMVTNREHAIRGLKELVANVGGVETYRLDTSDGPIIEIAVRREKYGELNSGLAKLGRWQPNQEPSTPPSTIRVVVRITG
jgi:putative zinc finger protein